MGVFTYIESDTGSNANISSATAVGAYTSTGDKMIMCDVSIDAVAGNGDYVMYVTRQIGGSGSSYVILPKTTMAAASGETAISAQSGWITVRNADVLTCYVDGTSDDTSTPDWTTRWFEMAGASSTDIAAAVWDEAISGHNTSGSFGAKNQKVVPSESVDDYKADVSALALEATLTAIKGEGWTDETLAALMTAIEAISAGGATADEIWDEALSGHASAGSAGKALSDILTDTGTDIPALIAALSAWQATNVTSSVASGSITDVRGSSWSIAIEDLTLDSNKQQFAIKRHAGDADAQALLLVDSATGLLTLNGVSTGLTAADASLVYSGTTLTLTVKAHITAQLPDGAWKYGIQYVTAAGLVEEPYGGTFTVSPDVVRAAS